MLLLALPESQTPGQSRAGILLASLMDPWNERNEQGGWNSTKPCQGRVQNASQSPPGQQSPPWWDRQGSACAGQGWLRPCCPLAPGQGWGTSTAPISWTGSGEMRMCAVCSSGSSGAPCSPSKPQIHHRDKHPTALGQSCPLGLVGGDRNISAPSLYSNQS